MTIKEFKNVDIKMAYILIKIGDQKIIKNTFEKNFRTITT